VKRQPDPDLYVGQKVVEEYGQPSRSVSVRRVVYDAKDNLLFDNTWYSNYLAEPKVVLVGTKPVPVESAPPATTETGTTTGTTTSSGTTTGQKP
jgi:uncharacterized protein YabE (DUF348 family)